MLAAFGIGADRRLERRDGFLILPRLRWATATSSGDCA